MLSYKQGPSKQRSNRSEALRHIHHWRPLPWEDFHCSVKGRIRKRKGQAEMQFPFPIRGLFLHRASGTVHVNFLIKHEGTCSDRIMKVTMRNDYFFYLWWWTSEFADLQYLEIFKLSKPHGSSILIWKSHIEEAFLQDYECTWLQREPRKAKVCKKWKKKQKWS